eukprot:2214899-Prymnesium_polylepis.1
MSCGAILKRHAPPEWAPARHSHTARRCREHAHKACLERRVSVALGLSRGRLYRGSTAAANNTAAASLWGLRGLRSFRQVHQCRCRSPPPST